MKNLIISLWLVHACTSYSQKYDYVWITGDDNQTFDTTYGGSLIDFNFNPVKATYHYRDMNMFTTNSSICDSAGNLLFYTNGCAIAGADDEILENGDNINPGSSHTLWCVNYNDGYAGGHQSSIILPLPDTMNIFHLFHKRFIIYSNPYNVISDKLYSSVVKIDKTSNLGSVAQKNLILMSDSLALGEMTAVKHANGKDWWLVTPRRNSNSFYIFKFTKEGVIDTFQQTIGMLPNPEGEGLSQIVFSPDGNKLYRTDRYGPVMVYTFDREAGVFTQFDTIHFDYGNQLVGETGCAVSPGGRYLYLSCRKFLYQMDLWAADVSASQTTVAEWDGYADPIPTLFWVCQLGPDCKIYIEGGDTRYYHVIHNPDGAGMACNVEQRGLVLPTPNGASMPVFPNYRLGPLDNPGVPCTATVGVNPGPEVEPGQVRLFPNPASDELTIEYRFADVMNRQFLLYNAYGQMVKEVSLPAPGGKVNIPVEKMASGVYWYVSPGTDAIVLSGKIIINH